MFSKISLENIFNLLIKIGPWFVIAFFIIKSKILIEAWPIIDQSLILQSLIGSASGAIGAAAFFYFLEQKNKKRLLLSSINTSLALMAGHISTLINYKSQHLIPLKEEKDAIINYMHSVVEIRKNNPDKEINIPPIQSNIIMQKIPSVPDEFLLNIDSLSEFAERFPMAIVYLVKSKEGLAGFKSFLEDWRNLIDEIRLTEYEPKEARLACIMGKLPMNGNIDRRVPDTIENLLYEADKALYFLRKASEDLQEKGEKILPKKIAKALAKTTTKDGYEKYMPPRDLFPSWDD